MGQQSWVDRELGYIVGRAGGSCLPKASPKLPQSFPEPPRVSAKPSKVCPKVPKVCPKSPQSLPRSPQTTPNYLKLPQGSQGPFLSFVEENVRSRVRQIEIL